MTIHRPLETSDYYRPMEITLHTPETIYSPRHLPSWFLLAGAAGFVNGFAFLECEQFVTHVTGTVTRAGLEWPHVGLAAEYVVVVVSFLAGAVASVIAIQARARLGKRPRWGSPLLLVATILLGVSVAGRAGVFGRFGGMHAADPPPVVLLSLLAFAMGLQNAAVASTTGLAVRTTHLSGPTTDLGIHLGVACLASGPERRSALRGAALRGGKVVAFMVGAGLAVPLTQAIGYFALLAPASFILAAAGLSFVPDWSPSDFPFRAVNGFARAAGTWPRQPASGEGRPAVNRASPSPGT
ncbi:MAG: YoaK family protein [Isosphaeraceae bacterium]